MEWEVEAQEEGGGCRDLALPSVKRNAASWSLGEMMRNWVF